MLRIYTDHAKILAPLDDLAVIADFFYGTSDLHSSIREYTNLFNIRILICSIRIFVYYFIFVYPVSTIVFSRSARDAHRDPSQREPGHPAKP
jgi:hypothetical protein